MAAKGVRMVVGFFVTVLIGAAVLPTAIDMWFNASTSGWGDASATLWALVPIFVIVAVMLYFVAKADVI